MGPETGSSEDGERFQEGPIFRFVLGCSKCCVDSQQLPRKTWGAGSGWIHGSEQPESEVRDLEQDEELFFRWRRIPTSSPTTYRAQEGSSSTTSSKEK